MTRNAAGIAGQVICHTEILKDFSEAALTDVLMLEKTCFPESWQYPDAEEYYREKLMKPRNITIFSKCGNQTIGYIIAVPFEDVLDDLVKFDCGLRRQVVGVMNKKLYIETFAVLPACRTMGIFNSLIGTTIEEGARRDVRHFCVHVRVSNNANGIFLKKFGGKITEARKIDAWHYGGNEPYEYIEWGM